MVVTLGALLADVPHSRPVASPALATDQALVERLGAAAADLRGPDRDRRRPARRLRRRRACPSASLWAAVPHYVAVVAEPEGRARAAAPAREPGRRHRRRGRARGRRRRLRAPGLARGRARPRRAGVRRAPRARRRRGGGPPRPGPAPLGRRARPRVPALPAPARRGDELSRLLALGGRAGDPVVAHRARRRSAASARSPGRGCPSATSSTVSVIQSRSSLGALDRHLLVVEHVVVGLLRRPRAATPRARRPRRARAGRPRAAARRSSAGRSCSRSARSRRRAAGRRGRRARAAGAGRAGTGTRARTRPARPSSSRKRSW